MRLRIDSRVAWQIVDGQAVIVDLTAGRILGLNPAGSLIWSLLAQEPDTNLAEAVAARFEVDSETALRDVDGFVSWLCDRRLVVEA